MASADIVASAPILDAAPGQARHRRAVRAWLWIVATLVFAMVVLGGATRLTQSGLSIVEWKPVTGAVPPLSDAQWQVAFQKYQAIPQYEVFNKGMSLGEFKVIYWWEWSHRQLGRLIGLAFALPLAAFWIDGLARAAAEAAPRSPCWRSAAARARSAGGWSPRGSPTAPTSLNIGWRCT